MAKSDGMSKREIREKAAEILKAAGVDPAAIPDLVADEQAAAGVVDSPMTQAAIAVNQFPSQQHTAYGQFVQGFGSPTVVSPTGIGANIGDVSTSTKNYQINEAGQVLFNNGVLYDPNATTGSDILFPQNDPDAHGSLAWFQKVQGEWKEGKIESWRERLVKLGYDQLVEGLSTKGGWDQAFKTALGMYHQDRYRNFGKPLPVALGGGGIKRADFGGALDPAVLKQEVTMWFQEAYGDDPSEDEADFWAKKLHATAMRLARKQDMDPGAAVVVAQAKTQNKFRESPDVAEQIESSDDDEMDNSLRDSLVSVSQLASI